MAIKIYIDTVVCKGCGLPKGGGEIAGQLKVLGQFAQTQRLLRK